MTYQTVNPFNNQLIKTYPDATDEDLENALARGHDLYKTWRKQEGPETVPRNCARSPSSSVRTRTPWQPT